MSSDKQNTGAHLVPVTIYGQTYSLRADDDPDYVEQLASFVDKRASGLPPRARSAADWLGTAAVEVLWGGLARSAEWRCHRAWIQVGRRRSTAEGLGSERIPVIR